MNIAQIILKELYAELNALGIKDEKLYNKLPKIAKSITHSITEDIKKNLSGKVCELSVDDKIKKLIDSRDYWRNRFEEVTEQTVRLDKRIEELEEDLRDAITKVRQLKDKYEKS